MPNNLPSLNNKKSYIYLGICLFFALGYFIFIKIPQQQTLSELKTSKVADNGDQNLPYFIPPKELYQESEIKGKVERLQDTQRVENLDAKATHTILDDKGEVMYYAYSKDDKLFQQEGLEVTLGIKTTPGYKPYTGLLVEVTYIAIK